MNSKAEANRMISTKDRQMKSWKIPKSFWAAVTLIGLVVMWELLTVVLAIPAYILPTPTDIGVRLFQETSMLWGHTWTTLTEVLLGFGLSLAIGIPIAITIVYSKYLANSIYPIIIGIQCLPMVSIAPILVIWFGYGLITKVILACLISFFPVVINAVNGFNSLDKEMHDLGRSLGISERKIFFYFRLPNALPHLFAGFKVGITLAVVGAIVGEFVASERGLGYLQLTANARLDTELVFVTIVVLAILGISLFLVVHVLERILMPWYHANKAGGGQ
ncbi:ABC transporter permease [Saliterribacillus persicus]|uniref:NitT/TauT family transport system permease protein n=1 Tax=Saliterribacillus persicus TaxID=930114 RepID=A0A368XRZ4_9BACI|nr:ABC transporter permease [Saliterribacillus persicus]RCW69818.1 NitT/TauT family transport system permease protein [Saliterribacillus persicus]